MFSHLSRQPEDYHFSTKLDSVHHRTLHNWI